MIDLLADISYSGRIVLMIIFYAATAFFFGWLVYWRRTSHLVWIRPWIALHGWICRRRAK
jgi:hypothetical protein